MRGARAQIILTTAVVPGGTLVTSLLLRRCEVLYAVAGHAITGRDALRPLSYETHVS